MTQFNYYDAPDQDVFDDIKANAITIWQTYDDTHGYATEKINRIKDITNIKDNAWYIVAMFDQSNQKKLFNLVTEKTREKLYEMLNQNYA